MVRVLILGKRGKSGQQKDSDGEISHRSSEGQILAHLRFQLAPPLIQVIQAVDFRLRLGELGKTLLQRDRVGSRFCSSRSAQACGRRDGVRSASIATVDA
ncbi:MAG: hypothetical protein AABO58_14635 [Acidobacteriota bacterium]